jgi:tetratricopeptide (TPR) repeat protein
LLRRHFLREEPDGHLDFSHPLARRVVHDDLSALARRRLHRRVADALVALAPHGSVPSAEIAFHYRHAGEACARDLLRYATQAGDDALLAFGFRQAVLHYDEALAVADRLTADEEISALMQRAFQGQGHAYEALGDRENLITTYQRMQAWAQRLGDQRLVIDASRRLVAALAVFGYLQESSRLSADLVGKLPADAPPVVHDLLRRIVLLLRPTDQEPLSSDWPVFQSPQAVPGKPWEDLVSAVGPRQAVQPLTHYGWALLAQGQFAAAEACLRHAAELAAACGHVAAELTSYQLLAQASELRGDWHEMRSWLAQSFRVAGQLSETGWSTIWTRLFVAFLDLRVDRVDLAADCFRAIYEQLAASGDFPSHRLTAQTGLGWVALRRNDPAAAASTFANALSEPAFSFAPIYVWACLGHARASTSLGNRDEGRRFVRQAMGVSGGRGMPREYVAAAKACALLAFEDGRLAEAKTLLSAAESIAREADLYPALLEAQLAFRKLSARSLEPGIKVEQDALVAALAAQVEAQRAALAAAIPDQDRRSPFGASRNLVAT